VVDTVKGLAGTGVDVGQCKETQLQLGNRHWLGPKDVLFRVEFDGSKRWEQGLAELKRGRLGGS
jgi:hypothetical protein